MLIKQEFKELDVTSFIHQKNERSVAIVLKKRKNYHYIENAFTFIKKSVIISMLRMKLKLICYKIEEQI